ncbi:hypothetical protein [Brevundimonas sp.]|uniref:hypothetical protein n=1 Tax=Brevundimonas sp. TaxID=1871086 RepID=UPI002FCC1313
MTGDENRSLEGAANGSAARPHAPVAYLDGFVVSAFAAPVMALVVFLAGAVVASSTTSAPVSVWQMAGGFLFLLFAVFITGTIPSLVFGGAVLALIRALRMGRSLPVCAIGGGAAATLYVIVSLAVAFALPTAALLFAPWAALYAIEHPADLAGHLESGLFWAPVSIVISGVVAGVIYARSTQKG